MRHPEPLGLGLPHGVPGSRAIVQQLGCSPGSRCHPSLSATVQAAARTQRDLLLLSFCRLEAPHGEPTGWSQRGTGYLHPAKAAFLPSPHRGRGEGALWGIFLSGF